MDLALKGRRALVTAASSGIGKACAAALVREGAHVFICARTADALATAGREIGAKGWLATEVTSGTEIERLVEGARNELSGLDILVTNAPDPRPGGFGDTPDASFDGEHEAVLLSVVRLIRLTRPLLIESPAARIVNISSTAAHELLPGRLFSATYRGALAAFAKHLSVELAPYDVTVNNIAPGNTLTSAWDEDSARRAAESVPLRRLGNADEVGALCAYLCSSQAAYITGQTLVIDGGMSRTIW